MEGPRSIITIHWQSFIPINDLDFSCLKTPSVSAMHFSMAYKFQISSLKISFLTTGNTPLRMFEELRLIMDRLPGF